MSKRGRLEAYYYFATAQTVSATNGSGGPSVCTVAAGEYTPTSLCTAFQTALNAGRPSGWTVTPSFGESGTGAVVLDCTTTFSLTWTSTTLAAALGFSSNAIVSSSGETSTFPVPGLWLPDCPMTTRFGPLDPGRYISDMRQLVAPDGSAVATLVSNSRRELPDLAWPGVSRARTRVVAETGVIQSFESWWCLTQLARDTANFTAFSFLLPGSKVDLYWDAGATDVHTYWPLGLVEDPCELLAQGWNGRWRVALPRLIEVT
jgi:hypothetical protein